MDILRTELAKKILANPKNKIALRSVFKGPVIVEADGKKFTARLSLHKKLVTPLSERTL